MMRRLILFIISITKIKIEDTAKGIRISVHVYANDKATAIQEALGLYLKSRQTARDNHIVLATVENNIIGNEM
jgi:hypothetical protein